MGLFAGRECNSSERKPYLGIAGAWALAFGCSVGWGSFVMPGTTFLPIAGPVGTAIGLGLGGLVMLLIAVNYHYLMNRHPDGGGTYTYTKKTYGYDHGFLSAWFLILTYIAIIWANATALPLIARTLLGNTFRFGYLYEMAGYPIYLGELLLALGALVLAALVCLFRKTAACIQVIMAALLFAGVIICFAAASGMSGARDYTPAYAPENSPAGGAFTIFALAPWAYVGFESISHSAAEAKFSLKKTFGILFAALTAAAVCYILLSLMAVKALPDGCDSWTEYIANLDAYTGVESQPTFNAAHAALGNTGSIILGVAALGAIFTGLIGNYIALSRLMDSMAKDGLFPKINAIFCILVISAVFPFFGRTAISWIVDVTTVGATIAYTLVSASAWKTAIKEKNLKYEIFGAIGMLVSVLFALTFLIPNLISVTTLSTESYLILSVWSICGFLYFRVFLKRDRERRLGKSIVSWVVLLGLIIFTSSIWMHQTVNRAMDEYKHDLERVESTMHFASVVQIVLIVAALMILLNIYTLMQERERVIEIEKARAEKTSRAKSDFLSNMSHEIRTPMNAIIGLQNIALKDSELTPRTKDHLEKIGTSANHLLGIINDILDMSRIESGSMTLKNEEFSFTDFLEQINIIINGQCRDKQLDYGCEVIGDTQDFYIGDDLKLKQVLINILGNAVKFTESPGSVTLTAEQIETKDETCKMRFVMKDTGIGMDPEYIPKIFETFSQEDESNTSSYGGSGLGMAITKNLVIMMNGEINVESAKGVGSTFTVTVPLGLKTNEGTEQAAAEEHLSEEEVSRILSGKRILIAEDVDQNAEILADLLELENMTSERAKNGEEAVRMFTDSAPGYYSAVLMDVRMPVMDGLDATRAIRALDRSDAASVPVIAMTANVFDDDVEKSKEAGLNAHLFKPVEPVKTYEVMARLITERAEKEVD